LFHLAQDIKQFRCVDLGDRAFAERRENVSAKMLANMIGVTRGPLQRLSLKPFQRDRLKAVFGAKSALALVGSLDLGRIVSGRQSLSRRSPRLPSSLKRDLWIDPDAERFALFGEAIVHPPVTPALGIHRRYRPDPSLSL
jgi:hypothetical protein